jgi:Tol biopolymer transport system component
VKVGRAAGVVVSVAACSASTALEAPKVEQRIPLVVAESGPTGGRLVAIDETGDRLFDVVAAPGAAVRDSNPAISPDGRWLVFASSRGRDPKDTALWLAPLGMRSEPMALTTPPGAAVDTHPAWTRDGSAIVFSSTRSGTFDLWRLRFELAGGAPRVTEPERLTTAPGQELTPSVAPDGTIAYAAVTLVEGAPEPRSAKAAEPEARARLEALRPDGTIAALTEGPADGSPSYSPDGQSLAFTRPAVRARGVDADLWVMPAKGGAAKVLLDVPGTDEHGPVWSRDGRFVLATSLWRGADGRPKISLVIFAELGGERPLARVLVDRLGAVNRITPAVSGEPLRDTVLRQRPGYLDTLRDIMRKALENATLEP